MADEPAEIENWVRQQVLGSGGFGVVTLWKHKQHGNLIAIKKCRWGTDSVLTPKHKERWANEVDIMQRLSHRGVVQALPVPPELERELRGELPLLCMEYCARGDLRQVLNRAENCCGLKEASVRALLKDVTNAVEYLHANKITHRDLKPENIVMQDSENNTVIYKLIDLGYAKELDQSSMCASFVGTLQYLAPELFLSKKYSCTVDYWSLGLVAHEIITGVRPFLPNMTPVAWMTHVQRKSQDDICAYENEDGTITFSSQLNPQNHISSCLQYPIEQWLRLLLDWDPKRRGRTSVDSEHLLVFSMLNSILEKKVVPVFCVPTAQVLSYEVDDSTELATLQGWVARDTTIAVADQELLLPRGTIPDPSLPASQCCAPNGSTDWTLFVLQRGCMTLPAVKPNIPLLVGQMIADPKSPVQYVFQKRAWAHAVYFLQQEANLYCNFLRAHRAKMLYVLSRSCELGKLVNKMKQEKQTASAQYQLYAASLAVDNSKAQKTNKSQINGLSQLWADEGVRLSKRMEDIERAYTEVETEAEAIGSQALQLQRSPFVRIRISSNLDSLAEAGQQCYEALRRRSKDQRQTPQNHADMARVVYNCLKHRDKLLHDEPFTQHLKQIVNCQLASDKVFEPLNKVLQQLLNLKEDINQAQVQRQTEIWTLLTTEIAKQSKEAPEVPVRESSMHPSPPTRGAIPKQPPGAKNQSSPALKNENKISLATPAVKPKSPPAPIPATEPIVSVPDTLHSLQIQSRPKQGEILHSLPLVVSTEDVIKENQNLRYMTQDLFNRSFCVYKDFLNTPADITFTQGEDHI